MIIYEFGTREGPRFRVQALTLRRAILAFRTGVLYPHSYSTAPIWCDERHRDILRDSSQIALASAPGAEVIVWAQESLPRWTMVEVARIPPVDPLHEAAPPSFANALAGVVPTLGSEETSLAPQGEAGLLAAAPRNELEARRLELARAMALLERQKDALLAQTNALRAELERRMEQVWLIELFLGTNEVVVPLRAEGAPAPVETKITVHQRVLCMDEEIAVGDLDDNPDGIGNFDVTEIHRFDAWVAEPKNLAKILPEPKGICALRIRRNTKVREAQGLGQALVNAQLAEADRNTYLLIRNGDLLYRLWIDVVLWPRLIPRIDDLPQQAEDKDLSARYEREKAERAAKHFAAGMVAVNGIIQRSTLLHPLPKVDLSVFDNADVEAHFHVVRDDAGQQFLGDGRAFEHLTWKGYQAWLKARLAEGVRVVYTAGAHQSYREGGNALEERTGLRSIGSWPFGPQAVGKATLHRDALSPEDCLYTLELEGAGGYRRFAFTFLYRPGAWGKERARRVRFGVYEDEVLPVDYCSWRVLDHLIRDRGQREHYGSFFQLTFLIRAYTRQLAERERPFVDLVLTQAGVPLNNEAERARAERLLRWWKLKTKEHRTLSTDEAKALRMILAAFRRGDDETEDPEAELAQLRGKA